MKKTSLILAVTLVLSTSAALAAEKSKALLQLEAARSTIDSVEARINNNPEAAADLIMARTALKKGLDISEKERQLFGFGPIKQEAELDIKRYAEIAELATTAASARLEKARSSAELEALDKQLTTVKARVKIFEDRKAELEKYKAEAAKCRNSALELEALKADNSRLNARIEKLQTEIRDLTTRLEESKKPAPQKETVEPPKPAKPAPPQTTPAPDSNVAPALKELLSAEPAPAKDSPTAPSQPANEAK